MILINRGYVSEVADSTRLFTDIDIDGEKKHVMISVGREYGKFLSPERADHALIGMLYYALLNGHDIICESPVTEELLYNVKEMLIPTLLRADGRNYPVKIQADIAAPLDKLLYSSGRRGAVGTGLSCGVDSFRTVLKHLHSDYPAQDLTHITVFDIGGVHSLYKNPTLVKQKIFERTEKAVSEMNLPLIKLESNFQHEIPQDNLYCHSYRDAMAIYALQKLWRTYYYASGYSFDEFTLEKNLSTDSAYFDLLLFECFSTSKLKIFSDGGECDREEKIDFIADKSLAQKYLHVCIHHEFNCGVCEKCLRTLLALDAANKLDNFKAVFNLEAYDKNRADAYVYLYRQFVLAKNPFYAKAYRILSRRHKQFFDSIAAQFKAKQ